MSTLSFADIQAAAKRLDGIAHRTPVLRSSTLNQRIGAEVWLKCENFQRMGAFKFRGAYNAISQLTSAQKSRGVLTHSSGNHAQAIALAGGLLGVKTVIVMPSDAPRVKLAATRDYGAEIVLYDRSKTTREDVSAAHEREHNYAFIAPFDNDQVIAGQGTAAKELLEETGPLDTLLVCLGGGGLLSGSAIAARAISPTCRVIGVEPETADDGLQSFRSGQLIQIADPPTIADGARTSICERTFRLIQANVDDIVCVSDAELIATMRFLFERMKIVVEPTGALAVAALLHGKIRNPGRRIGAIISGGNVDPTALGAWFAS